MYTMHVSLSKMPERSAEHTMRQWIYLAVLSFRSIDPAQTSQCVLPVDIHRTRSANALSARATKSQRGIDFVLDFNESIKDHGTCLVEVDGVGLQCRFLGGFIRVPAVDFEFF